MVAGDQAADIGRVLDDDRAVQRDVSGEKDLFPDQHLGLGTGLVLAPGEVQILIGDEQQARAVRLDRAVTADVDVALGDQRQVPWVAGRTDIAGDLQVCRYCFVMRTPIPCVRNWRYRGRAVWGRRSVGRRPVPASRASRGHGRAQSRWPRVVA